MLQLHDRFTSCMIKCDGEAASLLRRDPMISCRRRNKRSALRRTRAKAHGAEVIAAILVAPGVRAE
jgi:hypothetical protein